MLLMGLDDEYKRSLQYIENSRYQLEDACVLSSILLMH